MYNNLEVRARAIGHWRKLRMLVLLLIICGKSYDPMRIQTLKTEKLRDF